MLNKGCSHCNQNCILLYFLEAKNPYFVTNTCSKWLIVPESGPTPCWIFNALSIGVQHFNKLILAWSAYHKEDIVSFRPTEDRKIWYYIQNPHNLFAKNWTDGFEEKSQKSDVKKKPFSPTPGLNRVNSLMRSDNKWSNMYKKTCSCKLKVSLTIYDVLLPPEI